jgi:DNA-binding IclR family transcriptional regulator
VFLQVARYAQDPSSIAEAAGIGPERLEKIFATLRELGIVAFEKKTAIVLQKNFHLPKDSPMLLPHQTLMRTLATQRLVELPPEQRYSLAVTFSASEETRRKLHSRFLEFLKEAENLVKGSKSEGVYQMNFDLFPWIKRS